MDWVKRLMGRRPTQVLEGRLSRAATAGEFFTAELLEPAGLTDIANEWPQGVDLHFEQDKKTKTWLISGIVTVPQMYEFDLPATHKGKDITLNLRLPASPDPWTMWKDLPVDWDTLPYPKDDTDSARIDSDMTMIAASRRGRSHAHKALPRDDDMRVFHDKATGWHILTVADGAGSAPLSRVGSRTAVETVVNDLPGLLADHDPSNGDPDKALSATLGVVMGNAADALETLATETENPLKSFSTTLLIAIARQTPDGWFIGSVSVGDGLIGLIAGNTDPLMIARDSGEFAGQTQFLHRDALASLETRIQHKTVPHFTALIAMTDGVSDPMFESDNAALTPAAWHTFYQQIKDFDETALLDWLNFKIKGEHDDRTIAILRPKDLAP